MSCRRPPNAGMLHCAVASLLLTVAGAGESQPLHATVGGDVTLSCHVDAPTDPVSQMVEWSRPDLTPRFVHVRRFGSDSLTDQHPSYQGRTSVSVDGVRHGDVSLKLARVKLSDQGTYRCFVPELKSECVVQLLVSAVVEVVAVGGGVLECRSSGWFPEPELLWLDAEGNLLSAGPTEAVRGSDDLYTVSSRVTVEKRASSRYTCRVQQRTSNQATDAHIQVTDEFSPKTPSSAPTIIVVVVFVVVVLLVVGWKWRHNKCSEKKNLDEETQERNNCSSSEQAGLLGNERSSSGNYTNEGQEANVQTSHDPNKEEHEADENIENNDVRPAEETVETQTQCPDTRHEEETNDGTHTTSSPVNQPPIKQGDGLKTEKNQIENLAPPEVESKAPDNRDKTKSVRAATGSTCTVKSETAENEEETSHVKDENRQNLKVDEGAEATKEEKKLNPAAENEADGNIEQDETVETQTPGTRHEEETNDGTDTTPGPVEAGAGEQGEDQEDQTVAEAAAEGSELQGSTNTQHSNDNKEKQ